MLGMSRIGFAVHPSAKSLDPLTLNVANVGWADVLADIGPISKWAQPVATCHFSPADIDAAPYADEPVGPNTYPDWEAPVGNTTPTDANPRQSTLNRNNRKNSLGELRTNE